MMRFRITAFGEVRCACLDKCPGPRVSTIEAAARAGRQLDAPAERLLHLVGSAKSPCRWTARAASSGCACADVSATAQGFTNLIRAYGLLETLAGTGVGRNGWRELLATAVRRRLGDECRVVPPALCDADRAGNIYIADKNSHSVLRITTNGLIYTHAGTHTGGFTAKALT